MVDLNKVFASKVSLKSDFIFKMVFSKDKHMLKDFLIAITNEDIKDITKMAKDFTLDRYRKDGKFGILDIQVELEDGTKIDIEMQVADNHNIIKRQMYYLASMYFTSIKEAEKYKESKRVISIAIADFNVYKNNYSHTAESVSYIIEKDECGEEHIMQNLDSEWKIYTVQLPEFRKSNHDLNKKIDQWLSAIVGEDFSELQTAVEKNGEIMKAMEKVEELTTDQEILEIIQKEEDDRKNLADAKSYAYDSGKVEGMKQAQRELVKNAAKMKMDLEDICKLVGISIEEVKEILK